MNKTNNKRLIITLALVFILPVVLAKLALDNNWFNKAATNKGELLSPTLDMSAIQDETAEPKWQLLYVLPSQCSVECENALYSVEQVWTALGKEHDRVRATVISTPESDATVIQRLNEKNIVKLLKTNVESVDNVFQGEPVNAIFIADTLNNVILRYPLQVEQQQAILHSRDILSDLRKLLKLSRIG
ncbi:hypothetical protein [Paraglaciecola chathamensis]|uniref:hypothetical protein n=1 Tax=Paraglaciecola chathamensis TaxID=368405 RepID=UPI00270BA612|nr:hypothetical protein [Paraglaciecola chathamensis]MDO6560213.1 hypothetical protein [Paraglaciecola chathamensis]